MQYWSSREEEAAYYWIDRALEEDLDGAGDLTTQALIPDQTMGKARLIARETGVICGLPIAELVGRRLSGAVAAAWHVRDGARVTAGTILGELHGPISAILTAERTILNFLQRLSGVATLTRRFVEAVQGTRCVILDTRKTTPGWRLLEKYAVRCGGGRNHRLGLYDGILIKDNHLAVLAEHGISLREAVRRVRERFGQRVPVEIEADSLDQVAAALQAGPDMVLLDNMDVFALRQAVALRNEMAPHILLEASGGITLANVRAVAETGVDRISIGALTHSAPALDIALEYVGQA